MTTTDSGVFDTSQGTVHLILGCGGTDAPLDEYGTDTADGQRQAKVFTRANRPALTSTPDVYARAGADAVEDAIWSARRDTSTGYGIAVFDVEPAAPESGGQASIKVTQYHAVGADPVNPGTGAKGAPTPDYTEFETFRLVRPALILRTRSRRRGWDHRAHRGYGRVMDVLVIGAGVCGLTTAISLAEAGLSVTIRTAALPGQTTSVAAGAVWGRSTGGAARPGPGMGPDRAGGAVQARRRTRHRRADGHRQGGLPRPRSSPYYWTGLLPGLRPCEPAELPDGFTDGWHYTAPLATMPVYLGYLQTRFERAGGTLEVSPVRSLGELAGAAPVVVNCSGVAARDLVPDPEVLPVRGQVVIAANPGIEEFFISGRRTAPGPCTCSRTATRSCSAAQWRTATGTLTPNPQIAERIVAGALAIEPRLHGVPRSWAPRRPAPVPSRGAAGVRAARRRRAVAQLRPRRRRHLVVLGLRRRDHHRRRRLVRWPGRF